jgi:hypothetical protein
MSNVKVSREINSAAGSVTVTPSDTEIIDPPGRAVYVGGTGGLAVRMAGDLSTPIFLAVQAGSLLPICVDQVLDTDTDATGIIVLR